VLIALYENATPFELRFLGDERVAAEHAALWPLKKMPVLVDDGHTVVEASIIIEHLALHHPGSVRLIPHDPRAALEARMMDRFFDNYVMTPLQKIVGDRLPPSRSATRAAPPKRARCSRPVINGSTVS
jgi:glutathione S-transferase